MTTAAQPRVARGLFVATILVGSFLLFLVQPMVARMALPRLGGASNVWNSAMIVYQSLLLAGYAYAHWLSRLAMPRQTLIHVALLAACALTLPITLASPGRFAPGWEVFWVPLLLLLTIGPVFFAVAAQAPLMQRWFSIHSAAGEPWALYAASNVGSFAGLMAYPLLAEPLLSLRQQSLAWSLGYALLVLLVVACALARRGAGKASPELAEDSTIEDPAPTRLRVLHWIALSAVPSGLMLSTTTHLTTDIFAMPLLWVIPLGLYLLSFVVAFSDHRWLARLIGLFAPFVMLLGGGLSMISHGLNGTAFFVASLALLFVVSVTLHARLYELRPAVSRLTGFYLAMSIGGALGGMFTAILAPLLFDWVWEHPLLVLAAALLMPMPALLDWRRLKGLDPQLAKIATGVFVLAAAFLVWLLYEDVTGGTEGMSRPLLTLLVCAVGLLLIARRTLFVGLLAATMLAQGGVYTVDSTMEGRRHRSYFGVSTILDDPKDQMRQLVHGTTLHGEQSTDPARAREVTTYFGPTSGVGLVLDNAPAAYGPHARVGIIGLGVGTLACYRREGQHWTMFEIDPKVIEFSHNGTFTYLETCAPDARMVLGDGRLKLAEEKPGSFDVLVADAFSSNSLPMHLITEEAIKVYFRALSPDGVLVLHVSNRYIDMEPVVSAIARDLHLASAVRKDDPGSSETLIVSDFIVFARKRETLDALARARPDAPWEPLVAPAERAWTDDHASVLPYIKWDYLRKYL